MKSKKLVLLSLSSVLLGSVTPVLSVGAEDLEGSKPKTSVSIVGSTVDSEKAEIVSIAEKNGLLPSILMALWLCETHFGVEKDKFSVSSFVSEVISSDSELASRFLETGSQDEAIALLFKWKYSNQSDFVGSMNSILSLPSVKKLDKELYTKGVKPLYDKNSLGKNGVLKPISWVSLDQDASLPDDQAREQADSHLAFERVGEKRLAESKSVGFLLPKTDKQWWQFWKKGLAESKITFGKDSINVSSKVRQTALVFAEKVGWDLSSGSAVSTSNGLFAYGTDDQKVLLNKKGDIVATWSKEAKPVGFEGVQQLMKGAGGYFTIGLRSSSLLADIPSIEFALNKEVDFDNKLLQLGSGESVVGSFALYNVASRLFVISSGSGYRVVAESGGEVGSSEKSTIEGKDKEDLATYTPIKTEVGILWVQI